MTDRRRSGARARFGLRAKRRERDSELASYPFTFQEVDEERLDPLDLRAIRADDELLNLVGSSRGGAPGLGQAFDDSLSEEDQRLLALLHSLRDTVDAKPFPKPMSVDAACAAIAEGKWSPPAQTRSRLAAAAVVVMLGLSGAAVAATDAEPGDPLWGVSSVIDPARARSVQAVDQVTVALAAAQQALAQGRPADARRLVTEVQPQLSQIQDQNQKGELARESANLLSAAAHAPPQNTEPQPAIPHRDQHSQPGNAGPQSAVPNHDQHRQPQENQRGSAGVETRPNATNQPNNKRQPHRSPAQPDQTAGQGAQHPRNQGRPDTSARQHTPPGQDYQRSANPGNRPHNESGSDGHGNDRRSGHRGGEHQDNGHGRNGGDGGRGRGGHDHGDGGRGGGDGGHHGH
jgi:hypothetical protein